MDVVREVVSVLAVFGLLAAALWALRRGALTNMPGRLSRGWSRGWPRVRPALGPGRSLETIQRLPLTPQHSLHLVRIHGRELVVATHPHGCALLLETSGANQ